MASRYGSQAPGPETPIESVITSLAGFGSHRPQPLGGRTAIPAAFRYAPAASRRIPVACWMHRSDQPSRPRATTRCFFSSFKTLAIADGAYKASAGVNVPDATPVGRFSDDTRWTVLGDR